MGLARRLKITPAFLVACLALFVALSGTAVATTAALITGAQIKNSSITGADVKNKSLTAKDFKGSVRGSKGAYRREPAQPVPQAQRAQRAQRALRGQPG